MFGTTLQGIGFALTLPPGAQVMNQPAPGHFNVLPPGSDPWTVPSVVSVRGLQPWEIGGVSAQLQNLEQPWIAQAAAQNLGMVSVLGVGPLRAQPMGGALIHIREMDAITIRGLPVRLMILLVQGPTVVVEVICCILLDRWVQFAGPCMALLAGLNLGGAGPLAQQVQAVLDPQRTDQVEFRLVGPNQQTAPITAMPTVVGGNVIINVEKLVVNDHSITAGDIQGTGIVIGHHSTATVS